MGIRKYKYYFKKPKSEITKDILTGFLVAGALIIGSGGPILSRLLMTNTSLKKYPRRKVSNMFSYLRRNGLLKQTIRNNQLYISLTEEGKRRAGIFQLHTFAISRAKKWDKRWRVLLFDINELKRTRREAFRGMLKQLGFHILQKSVWIHPFPCQTEIELLRDFFGLTIKEVRLIETENLEDDTFLRHHFHLHE
jgi:DNA-binding transcriptional regulator PaaX